MNMVQKILFVIVLAVVVVLPAKAQMSCSTSVPITDFRSTSTLSMSGSAYAARPALNSDGIAVYTATADQTPMHTTGGPRKINTPGGGGTQQPIGDGAWLLMLLACVYAIYRVRRRLRA